MKPKLIRCLLWQDKTMDELLSEPLNRDLYKIYLELKEQEIDTGVTDEKIMNEVYYQCTKLVYENSAYPDFIAVGTGTWGIAAVIPKYLSLRLPAFPELANALLNILGIDVKTL